MIATEAELREVMLAPAESEHLEFKEAKSKYDFEDLVRYCCAIANEGGGYIVLGVTDKPPRKIVGTAAFPEIERTKAGLFERLRWRVDAAEVATSEGRVIVFHAPPRPLGRPIDYKGTYWMRAGDTLRPMSHDELERILKERTLDYSAEVCPGAELADLEPAALQEFRRRWQRKSGNGEIAGWIDHALLENAELSIDGTICTAAIVLLGKPSAVARHMPHAEVIFEYRSRDGAIDTQQRLEFRAGFLGWFDRLWETINLRNDVQHFQDGLFRQDVPTFGEESVREAVLNAICHRDYRDGGSVFIRQYPNRLQIDSPGGFPAGITPETILTRQHPRNRRIADALQRCGFVERSGQGADRMFRESVREGKPLPDFTGTDQHHVVITLHGQVSDPRFLRFLEQIGQERLASFSVQDFLVLDAIRRETKVPEALRSNIDRLIGFKVIERVQRGKFILSRRLYAYLGEKGVYTRKRGLDRDANKQLLLKHIQGDAPDGCPMRDLLQVLLGKERAQILQLLYELRAEGSIHVKGSKRAALWFAGPERTS